MDATILLHECALLFSIIFSSSQDRRVVVIGTSFIGMEVASYLSDKTSSVECIDIAAVPFERVLGERIGKALQMVRHSDQWCVVLDAYHVVIGGERYKVSS